MKALNARRFLAVFHCIHVYMYMYVLILQYSTEGLGAWLAYFKKRASWLECVYVVRYGAGDHQRITAARPRDAVSRFCTVRYVIVYEYCLMTTP